MRVLVVCKRQYTGKDLLDDRYGRLFELPAALARSGVAVEGVCLSYRQRSRGIHRFEGLPLMAWQSVNAVPGIVGFNAVLDSAVRDFRPDVVWASSDVAMVCAGAAVAGRHGLSFVADLYDNYESFGLSRIPGAVAALRRACRRANAITVVSHALLRHVEDEYGAAGSKHVLVNGVRTDLFHPGDRESTRRELGLPRDARLVGTAGALVRGRGIEDLLRAFLDLAQRDQSVHLVLAGPRDGSLSRYTHDRIIDLGILPHERIGTLFRALDVGVVCNRDTDFGRFCFPLKLHEMLACGLPVVAAAVGDVVDYLQYQTGSCYPPGDAQDLARKIEWKLGPSTGGVVADIQSWDRVAADLCEILVQAQGKPWPGRPQS